MSIRSILSGLALLTLSPFPALAQERAYFVTYDHYLEERGNLEVAAAMTTSRPKRPARAYAAPWLELEYGVSGCWTTELYFEGVTTRGDGHAFTGWRFENRFRPLKTEHRINPVLYLEYESINEASRIQKEIVGAGGLEFEPIRELREEHEREIEARLILSSAVLGWNLSENFIVEKNLSAEEGFEFGYAIGAARSLGGLATPTACRLCRENVSIGAELYGGLGSTEGFNRSEQRHYVAPVISWRLSGQAAIKGSVGFGLSQTSDRYLVRLGVAYEFPVGGR
jgi:hypothetical protein